MFLFHLVSSPFTFRERWKRREKIALQKMGKGSEKKKFSIPHSLPSEKMLRGLQNTFPFLPRLIPYFCYFTIFFSHLCTSFKPAPSPPSAFLFSAGLSIRSFSSSPLRFFSFRLLCTCPLCSSYIFPPPYRNQLATSLFLDSIRKNEALLSLLLPLFLLCSIFIPLQASVEILSNYSLFS